MLGINLGKMVKKDKGRDIVADTQRSRLCKELEKNIPENRNNMCKGPVARKTVSCLKNQKSVNVIEMLKGGGTMG